MSGVTSILQQAGLTIFQLAFQASPIILTGGIATSIPGCALPIIILTETLGLVNGLISGSVPNSLDDLVAQFVPMPGATMIDQAIPEYPLANLQVAANCTVQNPLTLSMMMIAPVRDAGGFVSKLATFTTLQASLKQHNQLGGAYTVLTPALPYTNMLLKRVSDITSPDSIQRQILWQFDFEAPLISASAAASAQNNLTSQLSNGSQINGQPTTSGATAATGGASPVAGTTTSIAGTAVGNSFASGVASAPQVSSGLSVGAVH